MPYNETRRMRWEGWGVKQTILVIDDEKPIADILQYNLEQEGYAVICAFDGEEAVELAIKERPDLLLLDIMLPKKDGLEVCREVRQQLDVPIIMLTAKDSEVDIVLGLELGADDYVTKPFGTRELLARVKSNLRRHNGKRETRSEIWIDELCINSGAYTVSKNGEPIELTHREFELLYYLARKAGLVLTREHLLQEVWGY